MCMGKNTMIKRVFYIFCSCFMLFSLSSQVSFSDIDLNAEDRVLFTVSHETYNGQSEKALFLYDLKLPLKQTTSKIEQSNPKILSVYPEYLHYLSKVQSLRIENRYGVFQYRLADKTLEQKELSNEIEGQTEHFIPLQNNTAVHRFNGDGSLVCEFEQTSPSKANLVVKDLYTGKKIVLSTDNDFSFDSLPALWAPLGQGQVQNSSLLVYEKKGRLYFINLKEGLQEKMIDEEYRFIGPGSIKSVFFANEKKLMYIQKDLVYEISTNELYTRALYSDIVGIGKIAGRLPSPFNSSKDRFWTSENGRSIVLLQDNRTLLYMELEGTDFNFVTSLFSYPFVRVPGASLSFDVFWTQSKYETQIPIIWMQILRAGKTESYTWRLKIDTDKNFAFFENLNLPVFVHSPLVSPNKTKLAFMGESMSYVYDINTWKQSQVFTDEKLISLVWKSDTELFLGGENTLRLWSWVKNSSEVLALSSPGDYAWDAQKNILSRFGRKNYLYDKNRGSWQEVSEGNTRSREVQNIRWRIFIDEMEQGHFSNSLFARKLSGLSTNIALFNNSKDKPAQRPRVALAIDALDSSDGLTPILSALHKNNIRASFFINGEFLRKFPTAVKEIASLGHQCGSMFYIPYTLDTRLYAIDETFIRRGLARNEDDFFYLIGKELSLIWHAPDYFSNAIIQSASKKAGYKLIDSPYPTGDTLTLEEATEKNLPYRSSSQIIDSIVTSLKPGLIIPISCGLQNGTRLDYLYDKIDVLIAAILSAGYDIVPVSDL